MLFSVFLHSGTKPQTQDNTKQMSINEFLQKASYKTIELPFVLEFFDINTAVGSQETEKNAEESGRSPDGLLDDAHSMVQKFSASIKKIDPHFSLAVDLYFPYHKPVILSRTFLPELVRHLIEETNVPTEQPRFLQIQKFFTQIFDFNINNITQNLSTKDLFLDEIINLFNRTGFDFCTYVGSRDDFFNKIEAGLNIADASLNETDEFEAIVCYLFFVYLMSIDFEETLLLRALLSVNLRKDKANVKFYTKIGYDLGEEIFVINKSEKIIKNLDKVIAFLFLCYQNTSKKINEIENKLKNLDPSLKIPNNIKIALQIKALRSVIQIICDDIFGVVKDD